MTTTTVTQINAILAVLHDREKAKRAKPEDNPLAHHDLTQLSHGLRKGADNIPAVNMAGKAPDMALAYDLEAARHATAEEGKADKSAKRMAEARRRAERKVSYDKIAASAKVPSKARMEQAWLVVVNLVTIIDKIAKSKQRWATRYLGSNADDIPSMAQEQIALVVGKQTKWDLDVLLEAAEQLGRIENGIPGAQVWAEGEPKHIKQVKKARKWLMGMVYNRIMGALVDSYTVNVGWESLDLITTVMASIGGVDGDPLGAKFKAERAPMFMAARFQRPGGIDPNVVATAVSAAITEKGLDAIVEFLLDEDNRQTNGAVMWTRHAEAIFKLTPGGLGDWLWDMVVAATKNHARAANARGECAMNHVRNLLDWLPRLIVEVVEAQQPKVLGWSTKGTLPAVNHDGERVRLAPLVKTRPRAVMASRFELYLADTERLPLQPALRFPSIEEAAEVLASAMNGEVMS